MRKSIESKMVKFHSRLSFIWMAVAIVFDIFDNYTTGYWFLALCFYSELKSHLYRIEDNQSKPQE